MPGERRRRWQLWSDAESHAGRDGRSDGALEDHDEGRHSRLQAERDLGGRGAHDEGHGLAAQLRVVRRELVLLADEERTRPVDLAARRRDGAVDDADAELLVLDLVADRPPVEAEGRHGRRPVRRAGESVLDADGDAAGERAELQRHGLRALARAELELARRRLLEEKPLLRLADRQLVRLEGHQAVHGRERRLVLVAADRGVRELVHLGALSLRVRDEVDLHVPRPRLHHRGGGVEPVGRDAALDERRDAPLGAKHRELLVDGVGVAHGVEAEVARQVGVSRPLHHRLGHAAHLARNLGVLPHDARDAVERRHVPGAALLVEVRDGPALRRAEGVRRDALAGAVEHDVVVDEEAHHRLQRARRLLLEATPRELARRGHVLHRQRQEVGAQLARAPALRRHEARARHAARDEGVDARVGAGGGEHAGERLRVLSRAQDVVLGQAAELRRVDEARLAGDLEAEQRVLLHQRRHLVEKLVVGHAPRLVQRVVDGPRGVDGGDASVRRADEAHLPPLQQGAHPGGRVGGLLLDRLLVAPQHPARHARLELLVLEHERHRVRKVHVREPSVRRPRPAHGDVALDAVE